MQLTPELYGQAVLCPHCRKELFIPLQQGAPPARPTPPGPVAYVPNYLVQAILTTIFCCQPFGIVAIVYAAQVDGKLASGDYLGARTMSENAKKWSLIALASWCIWPFLVLAWLGMGLLVPLYFTH